MKLKDKVAIVTGGGTGIGKGISRSLAAEGAKVVIVQSTLEKAERAADELSAEGFDVLAARADVSVREDVSNAVKLAVGRFGKIDILVNNAALTGSKVSAPFLEVADALLERTIDVNLKGTFIFSQGSRQRPAGSGYTISSVGTGGTGRASVYCATKSR